VGSNSQFFTAYILTPHQADKETHSFQEFAQAVTAEAGAAKEKANANLKIDEKLFSINREIKSLEIIKYVRDELNIVLMILRDQVKAVDKSESVSDDQFESDSVNDNVYLHQSEI
jgi:hypothetical protein